jgi:hypothetical protein
MPVTRPRPPAAHPPLMLYVPVKVALVEFLVGGATCPSRAATVREILSAVRAPVKPRVASRLKQFEPSICRAQGGGIAICAPHEAHYDTNKTNTKTHDAREISRTIWVTSKYVCRRSTQTFDKSPSHSPTLQLNYPLCL